MSTFCPCCGYKTLSSERHYDICSICFWEDDPIQYDDPFYEGGANHISLLTAKENFEQIGACELESIQYVRKPSIYLDRDTDWKPYVEFLFELCQNQFEISRFELEEFHLSNDIDEVTRVKCFIDLVNKINPQKAKELCLDIIVNDDKKNLWHMAYKQLTKYSREDIEDFFIKFLVDYRGQWSEIENIINNYFTNNH